MDAGYSVSTLCDEVTGACEGDCRSAFVGREAHAELTSNFVEYLHRDQRVSVRIDSRFHGAGLDQVDKFGYFVVVFIMGGRREQVDRFAFAGMIEIGRASCRERV